VPDGTPTPYQVFPPSVVSNAPLFVSIASPTSRRTPRIASSRERDVGHRRALRLERSRLVGFHEAAHDHVVDIARRDRRRMRREHGDCSGAPPCGHFTSAVVFPSTLTLKAG